MVYLRNRTWSKGAPTIPFTALIGRVPDLSNIRVFGCPALSSFIARLEIYHGSNLLEQIHEYGVLHTMWLDMTGCNDAHVQRDGKHWRPAEG